MIITVDNGATGIEEVAYAQSHGVDVIVTDHHTFKEEKPDAYAWCTATTQARLILLTTIAGPG